LSCTGWVQERIRA